MSRLHQLLIVLLVTCLGFVKTGSVAEAQTAYDVPSASIVPEGNLSWDINQAVNADFRPDSFDPLEADRPDFTESPNVVPLGRLQIEGGWTYLHERYDGFEIDSHVLPELLLRYGVTENIEFRLSWIGYASYRERDVATGDVYSFDGSTDLRIGSKLQVTRESGWRPDSALIVSVSAPIGITEWTSNSTDVILNYNYGWDLSERLSLGGSTGSWWTKFEDDSYTILHQSLVLGYGITERWGTFFEWFSLFYHNVDDGVPDHYLNTGFTYLITEDFQLDWRIGMGLSESADDLFTGVGFAIRR